MLLSYDYSAYAGLFAFSLNRPDYLGRLEPWAELWRQWTSAAFLREYRATAAGAAFLPPEPADFSALLDCSTLEKPFYELASTLNNRPDWLRIPLRCILNLFKEAEARR